MFLSVRGEAYLNKKSFQKINKERLVDNLEPFANPRNAAAGLLHRLESEVAGRWPVDLIVYDILKVDGMEFKSQQQVWKQLGRWGFKNSEPVKQTGSLDEICIFHDRLEQQQR